MRDETAIGENLNISSRGDQIETRREVLSETFAPEMGEKARSLFEMSSLGFLVPRFFVLSTHDVLLLRDEEKGKALRQACLERWHAWGSPAVAVRSSVVVDGEALHSFSGLFTSFLKINEASEIFRAITLCADSVSNPRVMDYCSKLRLDPNQLSLAVIIQEYIEAEVGGSVSAIHPVENTDLKGLVEFCSGGGQKLTLGQVEPVRNVLSWFGEIALSSIDNPVPENSGATDVKDEHLQKEAMISLSPKCLKELRNVTLQLSRTRGVPQEIEFALRGTSVFLLQSRDQIINSFVKDHSRWTTMDFCDGRTSLATLSPLSWSLYRYALTESLNGHLSELGLLSEKNVREMEWTKYFFGKPFWNIGALKAAYKKISGHGLGEIDFDHLTEPNFEKIDILYRIKLWGSLRQFLFSNRLRREYKAQQVRVESLLLDFPLLENRWRYSKLSELSESELSARWQWLLETHARVELEYFRTNSNAAFAKWEFASHWNALKSIDPSLKYGDLLIDVSDLKAKEPLYALEKIAREFKAVPLCAEQIRDVLKTDTQISISLLARWESQNKFPPKLITRVSEFLLKYGYLSERVIELKIPRWSEDLRFVLSFVLQIMEGSAIEPTRDVQVEKRLSSVKALNRFDLAGRRLWLSRFLPGYASHIRNRLGRLRKLLWLREELLDRSAKVHSWIREMVLEIERRKSSHWNRDFGDGKVGLVFDLFSGELTEWFDKKISDEHFLRLHSERALYIESFKNVNSPREIKGQDTFKASWWRKSAPSQILSGVACGGGRVRGRARLLSTVQSSPSIETGEILVLEIADFRRNSAFRNAAGIVCEVGGILSVAAKIAREFSIPAVFGVSKVTQTIRNGQMIEIDGTTGQIELYD